jgi:ribose 5-phosphate isomerase RpiB
MTKQGKVRRSRTIALISDSRSYEAKEAVSIVLAAKGWDILDLGVESPSDDCSVYELVERVAAALKNERCCCCVGLSLTGNSLQIDANKYDFIVAAPLLRLEDVDEALRLDANMCDIITLRPLSEVIAMAEAFVEGTTSRTVQ